MNAVQSERPRSVQSLWQLRQLSQSYHYSYCMYICRSSIGLCKSWRIFWTCIYGCVKWGHSKPSGWEPALVQNYASANASCWSADSKEEINRRWKREDPQSKEALEKESNLWDWLHMQGARSLSSSHTNHLDKACQLLHTYVCLAPSERPITRWEWSSHTSRVCAGNAARCFSIAQLWRSAIRGMELTASPPVWSHLKTIRMRSVPSNVWLLFEKPCAHHHSREITSAAPSQEGWPADRSCAALARREHR